AAVALRGFCFSSPRGRRAWSLGGVGMEGRRRVSQVDVLTAMRSERSTETLDKQLAGLVSEPSEITQTPPEVIPALLASLERIRTLLLHRLLVGTLGNHSSDSSREFLTADEVADLLRLRREYVYELARQGEIPSIRVGKYVRIPKTAFEEWARKR